MGTYSKKGEVVYNDRDVFKLDGVAIEQLKALANGNARKRARICLHHGTEDPVHEMVIVHTKDAYVRPHKHPEKTESFHVIEGEFVLFIFEDDGTVRDRFTMSAESCFLYRAQPGIFHTMLPVSEYVVFHEVTRGPFTGHGDSVFPEWAPLEDDEAGARKYIESLKREAAAR